ncbi:hypothetical protein HanPI659440_Chr13g0500951 [Helianthus annuus]|nr:hypothetical protein HanPI659440_Chr13g0500951 [Helianthus annuus]
MVLIIMVNHVSVIYIGFVSGSISVMHLNDFCFHISFRYSSDRFAYQFFCISLVSSSIFSTRVSNRFSSFSVRLCCVLLPLT